jgi:hypothetical protein
VKIIEFVGFLEFVGFVELGERKLNKHNEPGKPKQLKEPGIPGKFN